MNNFNGCEFIDNYCKNCNSRLDLFDEKYSRVCTLTCSEIQKIQQSHLPILNNKCKENEIYQYWQCIICNIDLIIKKPSNIIRPYWSQLYSCNEYLMIKANE